MMLKLFVLLTLVFLLSCGEKNGTPSGILKPAKMQAVLFDVLRADAFAFTFIKKDSIKNTELELAKLQLQIFAVNKISKDEFYKSFEFYKSHPDIFAPMLDSLTNKVNHEKNKNYGQKVSHDSLKIEK